jgi:hypothetical protein
MMTLILRKHQVTRKGKEKETIDDVATHESIELSVHGKLIIEYKVILKVVRERREL